MGKIISTDRLVPAWLEAAKYLEANGRTARNIMLDIERPNELTSTDRSIIGSVDTALRAHCDLSVLTVAGTIFPQGLYRRNGSEGLDDRFLSAMKKAKKRGTWGTYAMRMMQRPGKAPGSTFNPLNQVIENFRNVSRGSGRGLQSNYELGVHRTEDLDETQYEEMACELPIFDPLTDGAKVANKPCLSHLTFKLTDKSKVDLTAIYRSHYYGARALGNLVGLSHLMSFVANQAGLGIGSLTCISTHAVLDFEAWGGRTRGEKLLKSLNSD